MVSNFNASMLSKGSTPCECLRTHSFGPPVTCVKFGMKLTKRLCGASEVEINIMYVGIVFYIYTRAKQLAQLFMLASSCSAHVKRKHSGLRSIQ